MLWSRWVIRVVTLVVHRASRVSWSFPRRWTIEPGSTDLRTIRDQPPHRHHSDNMIEFMAIALIARPSPESSTIRHEGSPT